MPSVSQSWIKREAESSPYHAANDHPRLNPYGTRRGSKAAHLFLGDAVHRLALGKGREISIVRYPDYRSEAARNDRDAAIANGRIPILQKVQVQAMDMAELVKAKIEETLEGEPYETEVPIFWKEEVTLSSGQVVTVWCRGMLDVWCASKARILDVKTMAGLATEDGIAKAIENNDYAIQARFYPRGVEAILPELAGRVRFDFLWIETAEPYGHRAAPLDGSTRHTGDLMVDMGLMAFAEGMTSGVWPAYPQDGAPIGVRSFYHQRIEARAAAKGFQL